jgi:glutamate formiminotransferase/formiminotetrahydrofolate cyclodeaminase
MEIVAEKAQPLKDFFVEAIDKDTEAFNRLMAAFALPKKSDEDKQARQQAIDEATRGATQVPFSVLERSRTAAELALAVAKKGNRNSLSDAGVAGLAAALCAEGALYNVLINTQELPAGSYRSETRAQARQMCACVLETVAKVKAEMDKGLAD